MADDAPPVKRLKRIFSDSDSDFMDAEESILITDDEMSDDSIWMSKPSKSVNKDDKKQLVLKVPRKYTRVPQNLQAQGIPTSALISDKRKRRSSISTAQFEALERMPLDAICVFTDSSGEFKDIAEKFFAVKYRELRLSSLADPKSGKYTLVKVQRLLRLFGDLIWSLALDLEQLDERDSCADLLALVRNHCSATLGWVVL